MYKTEDLLQKHVKKQQNGIKNKLAQQKKQ